MPDGNTNENTIRLRTDHTMAIVRFVRKNMAQLIVLVAVIVLLLVFTPQFFNAHNLTAVARQSSAAGIAAIGLTFVILTGGIDMSIGSVIAMSGIVFATLAKSGMEPAVCLIIALLSGVVVGIVNAFGILFCGMQPFIMTIATASVIAGIAHMLCGGIPVGISNVQGPLVTFLGVGGVAGIPTVFLLFLALAVVFQVLLRYLPFGRYVYSVGSSFEGSRLAGVRTTRISMITYVMCSMCAALVGVINVCTYKAGYPSLGSEAAIDSIAAIVIGGASLNGGKGSVTGTVVGVLLLMVTANILGLVGVSTYMQQVVKGIIIIGAILLSTKGLKNRLKKAWRQM